MKLHLENIGKVKNADILLDGLTVIAGPNDMGKSTIGKVLFTSVQTLSSSSRRGVEDKLARLDIQLSALYERLGRLRFADNVLKNILPITVQPLSRRLVAIKDRKELDDFLNTLIAAIQNTELTPRIKTLCSKDLNNLRIILTENAQVADLYAEVDSWIEMEFLNNFNSAGCDVSKVSFIMDVEESTKFEYIVKNNRAFKTILSGKNTFLDDATYIESPLYLHMLRTINSAKQYVESNNQFSVRGMLPMHVKDLSEKLTATGMGIVQPDTNILLDDLNIEGVMNGKFSFDSTTGSLVYRRGELVFPAVNVASGLKSFGVLRMLVECGIIDANKMLIWDEPENHLHPEWQLNFAEILVQLCKAGYPILINTHSPYFLQSVRYYAAMYSQEKYVNYYMAESVEGGVMQSFRNVTEDLNEIFVKLAEPLNRVMNVDEIRNQRTSQDETI